MADSQLELVELTSEIVAAFISHNSVRREDLPELISSTYAALTAIDQPQAAPAEKPVPAVSVKKSITPDHLISLEDGKRYKSLKRHLSGRGLTPDEYRAKWDLPRDYPMVAPNYAKQRSELAKSLGLGRFRQMREEEAAAAAAAAEKVKAKRGRPRKAQPSPAQPAETKDAEA